MLGKIESERRGDDRGWRGWMASLTRQALVWVGSWSWWRIANPGLLQCMQSQRIRHDWVTEVNWLSLRASLVAQNLKICLQCRRPRFNSWIGKIPWRRARQPAPVFSPGESYGEMNLVGWHPWEHLRVEHDWMTDTHSIKNTAWNFSGLRISWWGSNSFSVSKQIVSSRMFDFSWLGHAPKVGRISDLKDSCWFRNKSYMTWKKYIFWKVKIVK